MANEWDLDDLLKHSAEEQPPGPSRRGIWLVAAPLLILAAVAIYVAFGNWGVGERRPPIPRRRLRRRARDLPALNRSRSQSRRSMKAIQWSRS
jgi:hypothetical protein